MFGKVLSLEHLLDLIVWMNHNDKSNYAYWVLAGLFFPPYKTIALFVVLCECVQFMLIVFRIFPTTLFYTVVQLMAFPREILFYFGAEIIILKLKNFTLQGLDIIILCFCFRNTVFRSQFWCLFWNMCFNKAHIYYLVIGPLF